MTTDKQVIGISLIFNGGSCKADTALNYTLNVTSMCPAAGKDSKAVPVITELFVSGACNYTIVYDNVAGCPVFSLS
jgi:hypothetical protein